MNPYQHSFGGNIPQDVAGKQGENVIFIVYTLKDSPETLDKVKDVCANFSALIRIWEWKQSVGCACWEQRPLRPLALSNTTE